MALRRKRGSMQSERSRKASSDSGSRASSSNTGRMCQNCGRADSPECVPLFPCSPLASPRRRARADPRLLPRSQVALGPERRQDALQRLRAAVGQVAKAGRGVVGQQLERVVGPAARRRQRREPARVAVVGPRRVPADEHLAGAALGPVAADVVLVAPQGRGGPVDAGAAAVSARPSVSPSLSVPPPLPAPFVCCPHRVTLPLPLYPIAAPSRRRVRAVTVAVVSLSLSLPLRPSFVTPLLTLSSPLACPSPL